MSYLPGHACLHHFYKFKIGVDIMKGKNKKTHDGKVVSLHEKEPLLKTDGFQALLDTITPAEVEETKELLKDFLKGSSTVDHNMVAIAYSFGRIQGIEDTFNDVSNKAGQGILEQFKQAHERGRQLGIVQTLQYFQSQEMQKSQEPQGTEGNENL